MASTSRQKTVLVTGANGFIGRAVATTFSRAGYTTYGLVRRETALPDLAVNEVIPVLGSLSDLGFLPQLLAECPVFDVLVSTTEQIENYLPHYEEIIKFLRAVAESSNKSGVRPLILFTSGCKDYGMGTLVDDPALAPHTEHSPIAPKPWAEARARNAVRVFDHSDLFETALHRIDHLLFRPTTLFGFDGSYYGPYFDLAQKASESDDKTLQIPAHPRTVLHGMHVLDVAGAYLAVAEARRDLVKGQVFNLSGSRYETIEEVSTRLVEEYGLKGVQYVQPEANDTWAANNAGFTQWVSSNKIRTLLGWKDRKPLFTEGLHTYRMAYEAASSREHEGVMRIKRKYAAKN